MKLHEIHLKLKAYSPEIYFADKNKNKELFSCMLATDYTKNFRDDILYVIASSTLNSIDIPDGISLVVINDVSFDQEILSSKNISYIKLSNKFDTFHIFDFIQNFFTNNIKLINSTYTLLNTLIKNKGLKYIVEMAASILNNPVVLIDTSFKILSHSVKSNLTDDPYWNENIQKGYCPYDFVKIVEKTKIIENVIDNNKPLIVDCFRSNIRKIVGKMIVDGKVVGYVVVLELEKEFIQEDVEITNIVCNVISEEIKKNNSYISLNGIVYENLILDLLENRITSTEIPQNRMKTAQCEFSKKLTFITIYNSEQQFNQYFNDFILNYLGQIMPYSRSMLYNKDIITIVDLKNIPNPKTYIKNKLQNFLLENHLRAGVSAFFSDMLNLKKYYNQSVKTLELSFILNKIIDTTSPIYFYDDYRFYHMLSATKDIEIKEFCRPELYVLLDYDRNNATDYFSDLYCYLKNNCNIKSTADSLFIHRNTMSYRIQKISEILNLDLTDGDIIFQLNYSYRILKFANKNN